MTDFKAGDKVEFIEDYPAGPAKTGDRATVLRVDDGIAYFEEAIEGALHSRLKLVKPEPKPAPLKIYLAGPMSGIEHYNFPAFFTAARKLRAAGHEVFNPAENDMATGFNALGMEGHEAADHGFSLREALKTDLSWICENADALVLLEGWEGSKGVRAEMALAEALGLPKYEMERLPAEVAK